MYKLKRCIKYLLISIIYMWGCLCYDKKYLVGKYFNRYHFSKGWTWILKYWFSQKILRNNADIPFPVPSYTAIANVNNIIFDPNDMNIFHMNGSYFQAINAKIYIGSSVYIAPGVGLITTNHDFSDLSKHQEGKDIIIGDKSWIGMNAVVLPGVQLGEKTIVGAGAVVTKSFPQGNCVIAGNPARVIREI